MPPVDSEKDGCVPAEDGYPGNTMLKLDLAW